MAGPSAEGNQDPGFSPLFQRESEGIVLLPRAMKPNPSLTPARLARKADTVFELAGQKLRSIASS